MTRPLGIIVAVIWGLLALSSSAHAQANLADTWCWSGFANGQDACAKNPGNRAKWHFHGYVEKGGFCYKCWDEEDSTCTSKPEGNDPAGQPFGFKYVGDACTTDSKPAPPEMGGGYVGAATPPPKPQLPPLPDVSGALTPPPPQAPPPAPPVMIKLAPPPLPKPTDYDGVITKVSPGPYAINTPIHIEGSAKTTVGGSPRKVNTGDFVIIVDGKEISRVHGTRKNGIFSADLTIPVGGNVTVRFEPKSVQAYSELPRTFNPATQQLTLAACRVEGKLDAPAAGEVLVADAPTKLLGHFVDAGGKPIAPAGAKVFFIVEVAGKEDKIAATVDAAGVATGTITVAKPAAASEDVMVRLIAEGGPGDVCPSSNIAAKVTALGVGIEIKPDKQCYKDRECPVTARFRLPKDPKARGPGEMFASSPDVKLTARAGGDWGELKTGAVGNVDAEWKGVIKPGDAGEIAFMVIADNKGWKVEDQATFKVMEPIELKLVKQIDLGTVPAGTASNSRCVDLSFAESRGTLYQHFKLSATKPAGCEAIPSIVDAQGIPYSLFDGVQDLEIVDSQKVTICLSKVPRCAAESPAPAVLTVQALSPDFPDQKATLDIKWKVTGRNPLACWWWLIAAIGGTLFVIFVGYGFIKPFRFNVDDQVQLAGKREQLARAVGRRLRDLPGGRSGWYKSASIGLLENGQATSKLDTAIVELHARKGEVFIKSRGGVERVSHQTKKLEPVAEAAQKEGHCASKNTVYSAGNLFFQIK